MSLTTPNRPFNCTSGCPSYQPYSDAVPQMGGICRAAPPLPVIVGQTPQGQLVVKGIWPEVGKTDWCALHPMEARRRKAVAGQPFQMPAAPAGDVQPLPAMAEPVIPIIPAAPAEILPESEAEEAPLPGERKPHRRPRPS